MVARGITEYNLGMSPSPSNASAANLKDIGLFAHHATALVGGASIHGEIVSILEKKHKIRARGNPDLFDQEYLTFTIDDARAVKAMAGTRPVTADDSAGGGKKVFILSMNGITVEAQNALLKLLEEPPAYAHFFLIIPSAHLLLPTVKSRMSVIKVDSSRYTISGITSPEGFLGQPVAKRLETVKALMEDITKEKRPKQDALDFLNALEEAVHARGVKKNAKALEAIETARTYMYDRAPSLKMLLEYVAMSV